MIGRRAPTQDPSTDNLIRKGLWAALCLLGAVDDGLVVVEAGVHACHGPAAEHIVPLGTLLYGERGTKRVLLEYSRLAMGFANVRAPRYGIRYCSGGYSCGASLRSRLLVLGPKFCPFR